MAGRHSNDGTSSTPGTRPSASALPQMMVVPSGGTPSLHVVWNQEGQGTPGDAETTWNPMNEVTPTQGDVDSQAASARRRLLASPATTVSPTLPVPPRPGLPMAYSTATTVSPTLPGPPMGGMPMYRAPAPGLPPLPPPQLPVSTHTHVGTASPPYTLPAQPSLTSLPPTPGSYLAPPAPAAGPSASKSVGPETRNPVFGLGNKPSALNTHIEASEFEFLSELADDANLDDDEGSEGEESEEEDAPLVNKRQPPIKHSWNLWPCFLLIWFLGAAGYYYYIRIVELNGIYGAVILAIELMGVTSFLPYAILLTRGVYPTGSPGLPPAGTEEALLMSPPPKTPFVPRFPAHLAAYANAGGATQPGGMKMPDPYSPGPGYPAFTATGLQTPGPSHWKGYNPGGNVVYGHDEEAYRFHVRVMVPCYKEPIEVVAATLNAARGASLPAYTRRTVYLCDDGKDPQKKALVDSMGPDVVYVTGRKRKVGEINGKSSNLNYCLKNVIYASWPKNEFGEIDWSEISNKEVVVVFDADMCAKQEFYLRILEVMLQDDIALCLSPQSFHNISADADLFNNINKQFWECWLPGAFAWGYIACTGTNFCIRARALAHCGWFPDYTITEDYALGMELKTKGYRATYLMLYLAEGEAPEEIRNVFRQRSRWNKGHFQVFFSAKCPLLNWDLPFFQRLWYAYCAWAPMTTCVVVPGFIMVPFMSVVLGYNPVTITFRFVLASTIYFVSQALISNYAYTWGDWKLIWFANNSNTVLWFTYVKAFINVMLSKLGMKTVAFKVTEKVKTQDGGGALVAAAAAEANRSKSMVGRMMSVLKSVRKQPPPVNGTPLLDSPSTSIPASPHAGPGVSGSRYSAAATPAKTSRLANTSAAPGTVAKHTRFETPSKNNVVPLTPRKDSLRTRDQLRPANDPNTNAVLGSASYVRGASPLPATEAGTKGGWERFMNVLASFKPANIREFDEMFDPLALFVIFVFSTGTFGFGVWQCVNSFRQRAPAAFDLNSPLTGSPYLIISTIWAFFNAIAPYLFLHYCVTAGKTFKWAAKLLMFASHFVLIVSIVLIWLMIPTDFNVKEALSLQTNNYFPNQVINDTNTNFAYVIGVNATPVSPQFDTFYLSQMSSALAASQTSTPVGRRRARAVLEKILSNEGPMAGYDPASLSDDELNAPGAVAEWQRSLLQSSSATADLSGGLFMNDHVKYNMPIGYSITNLAWSLSHFPEGYTDEQKANILKVIRAGAEYLMRCLLRLKNGQYVYVAQVGDPSLYIAVSDPTSNPEAQGLVWTAPQQDPYLNGQLPRKVWLMTEGMIGSDLLANAAAGLAAASEAFRTVSPSFSSLALSAAQRVYTFAALTPTNERPHSYCEFVPCTANITVSKDVQVLKPSIYDAQVNPNEAQCYYVDWLTATCRIGWSTEDCVQALKIRADVFKSKMTCCNVLSAAGVWSTLTTRAQGICAVPDNAYTCYIPNTGERTCRQDTIDPRTGVGCSGKGLEVYASAAACCNYLTLKGSIDPASGKSGAGVCASINFQSNTSQCYVPSLAGATCEIKVGTNCTTFGLETVFTDPTSCCNRLLVWFQTMGYNTPSGIQMAPKGICQYAYDANSGPITRKLSEQRRERRLYEVTPGEYWKEPASPASIGCTDNSCLGKTIQVNKTVAFYNSTSTLDDMAWAGVWMYRASNNPEYLGEAQKYMARHYLEDITPVVLNSDRNYYQSDWNNLAWATNVLLFQLTGNSVYEGRVLTFLNAWVFGSAVPWQAGMQPAQTPVNVTALNALIPYADAATNTTLYVVPSCNATHSVETYCFDGIDNDCDGFIDREDVDCGLFPVSYTPKELAYPAAAPSLPKTAAASWLGMVYADLTDASRKRRLRCWALGQAGYMVGATPDTRSYVVGYKDAPTIVQHRASSCPVTVNGTAMPCNWNNAYWPAVSNPQLNLVAGALLYGPNLKDNFVEQRINSDTMVSTEGTVAMTGLLAGLTATDTRLRSCELMFGVVQRLTSQQSL